MNALAGLAPTIDEVSRMCLTHYDYAIKECIPYSKRRKMRERIIRSDMQKLTEYGIINRRKVGKTYIYNIRAKKIIDNYTSYTYSLLDAHRMRTLYEEEIRPSPKNIDIMRQIRNREKDIF